MAAIHLQSRIIPEVSRCTLDTLSQILYDKTVDVGKTSGLLKFMIIYESINFSGR